MKFAARSIGILAILASMIAFGIGAYFYFDARNFLETAVRTDGTVIDFETSISDGKTMYTPVFAFVDQEGAERTKRASVSRGSKEYAIGDQVPIVYNPANPTEAKVDSFWHLWLLPAVFGLCGAPVFLFGLLFLLLVPIIIDRVILDVKKIKGAPLPQDKPGPAA